MLKGRQKGYIGKVRLVRVRQGGEQLVIEAVCVSHVG